MIYVYSAVLLLVIILAVCSHGYKKGIFTDTDTREDPLKFLYPTSARILDFLRKYLSIATNVRILIILKQLHVSENAAKESYLFRVKRISVLLLFITLTCMLGILLCIKNPLFRNIISKQRIFILILEDSFNYSIFIYIN